MFDILWLQHNSIITKSANKTTQKLAMKSENDTLVVFLVQNSEETTRHSQKTKKLEVLGIEC